VNGAPADSPSAIAPSVVVRRPAALLYGPAQVIVYGNPPFVAAFGEAVVGLPAREALLEFPPGAFELMALVFETNRPLASWIKIRGIRPRLIAAPRRDIRDRRGLRHRDPPSSPGPDQVRRGLPRRDPAGRGDTGLPRRSDARSPSSAVSAGHVLHVVAVTDRAGSLTRQESPCHARSGRIRPAGGSQVSWLCITCQFVTEHVHPGGHRCSIAPCHARADP